MQPQQGDYVGCAGRRAHHEMASPVRTWPQRVRMASIMAPFIDRTQVPR
jgi:hypothetical protein